VGNLSCTNTLAPTRSTRQQGMGSNAGGRITAPVRRLKQAWCNRQRTSSATIRPFPSGPP
jgi:hypothetical protein